jgi:hypothetical protein
MLARLRRSRTVLKGARYPQTHGTPTRRRGFRSVGNDKVCAPWLSSTIADGVWRMMLIFAIADRTRRHRLRFLNLAVVPGTWAEAAEGTEWLVADRGLGSSPGPAMLRHRLCFPIGTFCDCHEPPMPHSRPCFPTAPKGVHFWGEHVARFKHAGTQCWIRVRLCLLLYGQ